MQKQTAALLVGALLLVSAGALVAPQFFAEDEVPIVRWSTSDEMEITVETGDSESAAALDDNSTERSAVEIANNGLPPDETRVAVMLRGRVVDKFSAPVPAATVWLDYSRGGQRGGGGPGNTQRRIPDPVQTDSDGRFAFQGQAFRSLRVSLQVAHQKHAAGLFDKDLGEVGAEVDLGDLMLKNGGEILGRVTDLDGNAIPAANIQLTPENSNRWRQVRNRKTLIADQVTDSNGYYRVQHVPVGDWSASATAKMRTEGRSSAFATEEDQQTQVDDIQLGPGFEVTGFIRTSQGQPIAKANVSMRSTGRPQNVDNGAGDGNANGNGGRGGRGGPGAAGFGGFGRDHSTETDEQGRFFLEHLPGATMRLDARADGYLDFRLEEIDPKLGQPLQIALQDGLRIAGTVVDGTDSQPVVVFAVRASRIRNLPVPGMENVDLGALMQRMRSGDIDDATRQQLRSQMESLRGAAGSAFAGGRGGQRGGGQDGGNTLWGGGGGRQGGLGKAERHPGGTFVETGLQEGVYEVSVQSPDHALYRSAEIEVRVGQTAPTLTVQLDRGFYLAGVVMSNDGLPLKGAKVTLRASSSLDDMTRGRGGRGRGSEAANTTATTPTPDFAAVGRDFQRMMSGASARVEGTTNRDGEFVLKHIAAGQYRLTCEADGYADAAEQSIELIGDRSDVRLELGTLGELIGQVRGLRTADFAEAQVAAMPVGENGGGGIGAMMGRGRGGQGGGGPFQTVQVAADGSYAIKNLTPGNYLVRAWVGSQQDILRELMPKFLTGELPADVLVKGGETQKLDLQVVRAQLGEVSGSVMHNGTAAAGFRVELVRNEDNGNGNADAGRGGRGGGRGGFGGRGQQQATVAGSGTFTIEKVPAGEYQLRVQADRTMLHEEKIYVVADAKTECHVRVETSSLRGTVTSDDGTQPGELNGNVTLHPGLAAVPEDYQVWRRTPGNISINARVQAGQFAIETLPAGNYLMVLTVRGRERTTQQVVVPSGGAQQVAALAGKVAPEQPAAPGTGPGAGGNQPGAAGGRRGAGGASAQPGARRGGGANGGGGNGAIPQPGGPGGRRGG